MYSLASDYDRVTRITRVTQRCTRCVLEECWCSHRVPRIRHVLRVGLCAAPKIAFHDRVHSYILASKSTAWRARTACSLACKTNGATLLCIPTTASNARSVAHAVAKWVTVDMSHLQPLPASNIRRQPVRVPARSCRCTATSSSHRLPTPLTIWLTRSATCSWTPRAHDALAKAGPGASSCARRARSCAGKCPPSGVAAPDSMNGRAWPRMPSEPAPSALGQQLLLYDLLELI